MAKPIAKKSSSSATKTSTATKTATATKTSTDAYTQGNITVTGGAGAGPTNVTISLPGGSLEKEKSGKVDKSAKTANKVKPAKRKVSPKLNRILDNGNRGGKG